MTRRLPWLFLALALAWTPALAEWDFRSFVEREAAGQATALVPLPDRFEILSARFGGSDVIPETVPSLEVVEAVGPNRSGMVRIRFRMVRDGRTLGEARATVRGRVRGPALTAGKVLARGEPVRPDDVEMMDVDLTRLDGDPVRDPGRLAGMAPVRTLGKGRILDSSVLSAAPVVRRGDLVDLQVRRGRLIVRAKGLVRQDGAPGDTVTAVNAASGAELLAEVQADGSLVVVRGPIPGRSRR